MKTDARLPWSHYVARLGEVEVSGRATVQHIAEGFLRPTQSKTLDLGAISGRLLDRIQRSSDLDRAAPFLARRTRLRFAVYPGPVDEASDLRKQGQLGLGEPLSGGIRRLEFAVEDDVRRTLLLQAPTEDLAGVVALCEDLALHDWLLTTVLQAVEDCSGTNNSYDWIVGLRPVIDNLLHLWMPAARVADAFTEVWEVLERRPGFTRQWEGLVARIRDQMALAVIGATRPRPEGPTSQP
jgi:hypothetical protein